MPPKKHTPTPVESARDAGLHYTTDAKPGISRLGNAPRFRYVDAHSKPVRDADDPRSHQVPRHPTGVDRGLDLPEANGHLQVTGRDARGRKQSRYHPRWREVRDENKYERMMHFGKALPVIRKQVDHDLALPGSASRKGSRHGHPPDGADAHPRRQ